MVAACAVLSTTCPLLLTGCAGSNVEAVLSALGGAAENCPELTGVAVTFDVGANLALGVAELDNAAAGLSARLNSRFTSACD